MFAAFVATPGTPGCGIWNGHLEERQPHIPQDLFPFCFYVRPLVPQQRGAKHSSVSKKTGRHPWQQILKKQHQDI